MNLELTRLQGKWVDKARVLLLCLGKLVQINWTMASGRVDWIRTL
jgi:hypothetical protein